MCYSMCRQDEENKIRCKIPRANMLLKENPTKKIVTKKIAAKNIAAEKKKGKGKERCHNTPKNKRKKAAKQINLGRNQPSEKIVSPL